MKTPREVEGKTVTVDRIGKLGKGVGLQVAVTGTGCHR
jgi:hypothetical protein